MKNTIGILGTGRMAVRLAKLVAACGHEVILAHARRNARPALRKDSESCPSTPALMRQQRKMAHFHLESNRSGFQR